MYVVAHDPIDFDFRLSINKVIVEADFNINSSNLPSKIYIRYSFNLIISFNRYNYNNEN